jgi:hypothetical protein
MNGFIHQPPTSAMIDMMRAEMALRADASLRFIGPYARESGFGRQLKAN